ncbi:signal transduction histidine kinase [Conyzicola nivalis]|uniref:histidine kinase n=1 Tax=Conyzicola nivalis TaxID=1477021 RepID=A0ABV2QL12_9MICO
MARRPGPTRRPLTLRVRITLATTVVAAVALVAGAVVFGVVLRTSLLDAVAASAETYASDLSEGSGSSLSSAVAELDDDDRFLQLRNDDGAVVAASDGADDVPPVSESDTEAHRIVTVDGDDYLVVAEETDDGTLVVGQSIDDAAEAVATVTAQLAVAVPLVVLLMAATTWVVVGRALRPVERMRREVAAVTATRLDRRIAEPGTDDEIGRLAATMNGMLDRLDASQSAQRRFISDASHELRSPLSSLRQFAEVARAHPDRVDGADLSEAILDEGARLERLVDGMLALARADEQVLVSAAAPVDLDDIVLAEVRRLRASGGVRIDASAVGAARIAGDAGLLSGLVRNLVDNAARHAASELRIELAETQDGVTFAVDDDGPGVPERERERIFDRFVRLDDARAREAGGSGLGLAIAREIALAHGGTVTAHASPLGGARFEVLLPAASD